MIEYDFWTIFTTAVVTVIGLVCAVVMWLHLSVVNDPYGNALEIDRTVGDTACSRVLKNLGTLDRFYKSTSRFANYRQTESHRRLMDQVEVDSKVIMSAPPRAQSLFIRTLAKLGYIVITYKEEDGDVLWFEIHGDGYSIDCRYG